jgi:hypothetical protein
MDKPLKQRSLNAKIDAIQRNLRELWRDLSRLPGQAPPARRKRLRRPRR